MTSKSEIRGRMADRRRALPAELRQWLDRRLAARAVDVLRASTCETAVLFSPMGGEPDIISIEESAGPEIQFAYPRVGEEGLLEFRYSRHEELAAGWRGLMEPSPASPRAESGQTLVFVPAVALSCTDGSRIGRGGGHYDRALAAYPEWVRVAVVYDFQLTDQIVAEPHDEPMDGIVTPSAVYLGGGRHGRRLWGQRTGDLQ